MVNVEIMCKDLEECVGKDTYGTPQTINMTKLKQGGYKIMCAGLIVAAMKAQGGDLYNGSNTIWRKWLTDKGSVSDHKSNNAYPKTNNPKKSSQLQKGMAVFKWNPVDTSKYPDGQGDYQHIGIVTSVNPLRIVHASSVAGQVTVDTSIGKFCAWGYLKGVDYNNYNTAETNKTQDKGDVVMSNKIRTKVNLNLRKTESTKSVRLLTIPKDTELEYSGDINNDSWLKVRYNAIIGYVLNDPTYIQLIDDVDDVVIDEYDGGDEDVVDADNLSQSDYIIKPSDIAYLTLRVEALEKQVAELMSR